VATVCTIGHSRHSADRFLELLDAAGVTLLVDVRTTPASRWAPFTNRSRLEALLAGAGIGYRFMGDALGGRPRDPSLSDAQGRPDYARMAARPGFQQGIQQVLDLIPSGVVCLMCGEEDPAGCHRSLLVGRALQERGVALRHLRGDGAMEDEPAPDAAPAGPAPLPREL